MTPDDSRHGTEAGCREHYRQGQKPCPPCLEAHRRRNILRKLYPHKCPAIGAQRRIQALQALGHGRERIATELGYADAGAISNLMRADRKTLLITTHDRIADVYDRLSMIVPDGPGPARARTWARRHGYAPPLAWDNIDTDEHPRGIRYTHRPDTDVDPVVVHRILSGDWRLPCTPAEKTAACEGWVARGGSLTDLGRLTGWKPSRYLKLGEDAA